MGWERLSKIPVSCHSYLEPCWLQCIVVEGCVGEDPQIKHNYHSGPKVAQLCSSLGNKKSQGSTFKSWSCFFKKCLTFLYMGHVILSCCLAIRPIIPRQLACMAVCNLKDWSSYASCLRVPSAWMCWPRWMPWKCNFLHEDFCDQRWAIKKWKLCTFSQCATHCCFPV